MHIIPIRLFSLRDTLQGKLEGTGVSHGWVCIWCKLFYVVSYASKALMWFGFIKFLLISYPSTVEFLDMDQF